MLFVKGMVNSDSAQGKEQRNGRPASQAEVRDSGQRLHPADSSSISADQPTRWMPPGSWPTPAC